MTENTAFKNIIRKDNVQEAMPFSGVIIIRKWCIHKYSVKKIKNKLPAVDYF